MAGREACGAGGLGGLLLVFAGHRGGVEPWAHSTSSGQAGSTAEGGKPLAVGKILSRREQQVLAHVLTGKTSREIGELIGLSARTVEFHRANLMAKLGSPNPTDLLIRAKKLGLG